jgi:hypothetical protein
VAFERADFLKNTEREIACAATEIENPVAWTEMRGGGLRDQFQHERRIEGRLLPRLQSAESFDVMIEARADFIDGRFLIERNREARLRFQIVVHGGKITQRAELLEMR